MFLFFFLRARASIVYVRVKITFLEPVPLSDHTILAVVRADDIFNKLKPWPHFTA